MPAGAWPDWVMGNHDQSRIASRIGRAQARIAMVLLLTLRGTPILYYGDELGLAGHRDPARQAPRPFRAEHARNGPGAGSRSVARCHGTRRPKAGFTTGDPWLPIGSDGPGSSVEAQRSDRKLDALDDAGAPRSAAAASLLLSRGSWSPWPIEGEVLAYLRQLGEARFAVLLNLKDERSSCCVSPKSHRAASLFSTHERGTHQPVRQDVELAANEGLIIAL